MGSGGGRGGAGGPELGRVRSGKVERILSRPNDLLRSAGRFLAAPHAATRPPLTDTGGRPVGVRSDRSWRFDVEPERLWSVIASTDRFDSWWPWLRSFDPGEGLRAGESWRCVVAPPLPYVVRFEVHLDDVVPARTVTSRVTGDVVGDAVLTLRPAGGGTEARLVSDLRPEDPVLRAVGTVARPIVEWGHDWVLDQGCRQFVGRAL